MVDAHGAGWLGFLSGLRYIYIKLSAPKQVRESLAFLLAWVNGVAYVGVLDVAMKKRSGDGGLGNLGM
jgi:hypothetical protein